MGTTLPDFTVGEIGALDTSLDNDVAPHLGLPIDPLDIDQQQMMTDADASSRRGIIQGLQDLGYLEERDANGNSDLFTQIEMDVALEHWKSDTRNTPSAYRIRVVDEKTFRAVETLDFSNPLTLLSIQTGFDGDLELELVPMPGDETSLQSRIMQFRLKTLNRFGGTVGEAFSEKSFETFQRLRLHFGEENESDLTLFNILGSGLEMSEDFCEKYNKQLFVSKHEVTALDNNNHKAEEYYLENKVVFKKVKRHGSKRQRHKKKLSSSIVLRHSKTKNSGMSLDHLFASDVNSLGLELLQLRLWQHGYYRGHIDADWGPESQEAFEYFAETHHKEFKLKRKFYIAEVTGGHVMNLVFLLKDLIGIAEGTADSIKKEDIEQLSEAVFPGEDEEDNTDENWSTFSERASNETNSDTTGATHENVLTFRHGESRKTRRRRRINFNFFGIKAAISGWFRRIKKAASDAFSWVKDVAKKIRNAIMQGLKTVGTFFRHALDKIKRVFRIAKAAVKRLYYWIAGKPFGTGDPKTMDCFMTRWSLDFDTVNFTTKDCPPELSENHLNRISFMNSSFSFMVILAIEVIGIVIKLATGNWLRLAWGIYKGVRDLKAWMEENPFEDYSRGNYVT